MDDNSPLSIPQLADWLSGLIAIPSVTGTETQAREWLHAAFRPLAGEVFDQPFPNDIETHEEYVHDPAVAGGDGRANLIARWPGRGGGGRTLIVQTHIDTVPYDDWDGDRPLVDGTRVTGRGACDCKGQLALLYQVARRLGGRRYQPAADLEFQLVAEEEIGGNGAVAALMARPHADAVVVLEPTGLRLYAANRGALWFQIDIEGRATHMGRKWEGVNAVELGCEVIELLAQYETRLLEESRGVPLFESYETPVQVNVGSMHGGNWPSMVPADCTIEGGVGFLPNKNREVIAEALRKALLSTDNAWLRDHHTLRFDRLRNEAFATPTDHPLVSGMSQAVAGHGLDGTPLGWNVSCDARLYATVGGMPVVVFGAGDIAHAHAKGESIDACEIDQGSRILADFIAAWCQ